MWKSEQSQSPMALATIPRTSNSHAIQQIIVEKLFGQFTYRLGASNHSDHLSNLMILYGDNGSGKTTILQLLTHLLSCEQGRGHKTFVARIPFERFAVVFADGTSVEARREPNNLSGSYTVIISRDQEVRKTIGFRADEEGVLIYDRDEIEKAKTTEFLETLRALNISLHYLSDDRKLHEEVVEGLRRRRRYRILHPGYPSARNHLSAGDPVISYRDESEITPLELALDRAFSRIRDQADRGIEVGQRDTNKIYTDVIRVIAESHGSGGEEDGLIPLRQLREDLQRLAEKSRSYSRYGLMSPLIIDEVLNIMTRIEGVDFDKSKMICEVLKPYAEGFEARQKALSELYSDLELFVNTLNGFFRNKEISFNLRRGFQISSKNGGRIKPSWLSSGEKQILLLFCNTLASRDQAAIFIIDEPELSLNIKWQRLLVQSLLKCIKGSPVQFILATHSIELLAQHMPSVVELKNLAE